MNRREFLLPLLSLAGCASLPGVQPGVVHATAPRFGRFTSLPRGGRVTVSIHFHDTEAAARAACAALNQRSYPGAAPRPPACTSDTYSPGLDHINLVRPRDWDDLERIVQLGHEVLHALGADHN